MEADDIGEPAVTIRSLTLEWKHVTVTYRKISALHTKFSKLPMASWPGAGAPMVATGMAEAYCRNGTSIMHL